MSYAKQMLDTYPRTLNVDGGVLAAREPFCLVMAESAAAVLSEAGFEVIVPDYPLCCGLTWISTGQLERARTRLQATVAALERYAERGLTIVGSSGKTMSKMSQMPSFTSSSAARSGVSARLRKMTAIHFLRNRPSQ